MGIHRCHIMALLLLVVFCSWQHGTFIGRIMAGPFDPTTSPVCPLRF